MTTEEFFSASLTMRQLLPLVRISAKKSFLILRNKSPLHCADLSAAISVGKIFFQHISFSKRKRNLRDLIERLLIIPFIDDILMKGEIVKKQDQDIFFYFKISYQVKQHSFSVIICKSNDGKYILLSCFKD